MRVLGIDLAGVTGSTGYAVLEGGVRPALADAGLVAVSATPALAEDALVDLIDEIAPDRLAIDAPLTLPPCLTCPSYCRGPGEWCELTGARQMWEAGSNPVIRRQCEVELRRTLPGADPKPTMGLGIITARAVALVGKLEALGRPTCSIVRGELIEVYPAASLMAMGWSGRPPRGATPEDKHTFFLSVTDALAAEVDDISRSSQCTENDDVFDALIAAYTGWLYPDRVVQPPVGFNVAAGWIWVPKAG